MQLNMASTASHTTKISIPTVIPKVIPTMAPVLRAPSLSCDLSLSCDASPSLSCDPSCIVFSLEATVATVEARGAPCVCVTADHAKDEVRQQVPCILLHTLTVHQYSYGRGAEASCIRVTADHTHRTGVCRCLRRLTLRLILSDFVPPTWCYLCFGLIYHCHYRAIARQPSS